jgi:protein SCO1
VAKRTSLLRIQGTALAALVLAACMAVAVAAPLSPDAEGMDLRAVLDYSQAAVGGTVSNHRFRDTTGRTVSMDDYRGKPLVVSLIYTSCAHSCSMATRHLDKMVRSARKALGEDSFTVLTIGFDSAVDTPEAMRNYAAIQRVGSPNWHFLSADAATVEALVEELGFVYYPSPRGFDHVTQATVIDAAGVVYRQVYGEVFTTPMLVEPLKELVFGVSPTQSALENLTNRVKLFCTVYDAAADRYKFDYSLFVGIAIGALIIGLTSLFLLVEYLRYRRSRVRLT